MSFNKKRLMYVAVYLVSIVVSVCEYRYINNSESYKESKFLVIPRLPTQVVLTLMPVVNTSISCLLCATITINYCDHHRVFDYIFDGRSK